MINGGNVQCNCIAGVVPSNISTAFGASEWERAEESPYAKMKPLLMGSVGVGQNTVTSYMSTAKIEGVVRPAVQIEDGYSALISANPSNPWYWHVLNYQPGQNASSVFQRVRITYYCVFEGRLQLNVS